MPRCSLRDTSHCLTAGCGGGGLRAPGAAACTRSRRRYGRRRTTPSACRSTPSPSSPARSTTRSWVPQLVLTTGLGRPVLEKLYGEQGRTKAAAASSCDLLVAAARARRQSSTRVPCGAWRAASGWAQLQPWLLTDDGARRSVRGECTRLAARLGGAGAARRARHRRVFLPETIWWHLLAGGSAGCGAMGHKSVWGR